MDDEDFSLSTEAATGYVLLNKVLLKFSQKAWGLEPY